MDKFLFPAVFFPPIEELHNTRYGSAPGHLHWGDFPPPGVSKEDYMRFEDSKWSAAERAAYLRQAKKD